MGCDLFEGQMEGNTELLNPERHHNGYSWTEETQSLSQARAGAGWGGEEGGVPPDKIYGYLAESAPIGNTF